MAPDREKEIFDRLGRIDQGVAVLKTKLFGDEDGEESEGRLPRLETRVNDHGRRIKRLESLAVKIVTIAAVLSFLVEVYARFRH